MAPCVLGRDDRELQESARRIGALYGRDPKDVLERDGTAFARVSRVFDILPGMVAPTAPPPPPPRGAAPRDSALDEVLATLTATWRSAWM